MTFEKAIEHVLEEEGGYANNPNDRGGETNFGISKRSYPNVDIRGLTKARAIEIYRRDFWSANDCDALPAQLRLAYFDCAINCGSGAAARLLQEAVGVPVDGKVGPQTRAAIAAADPVRLVDEFMWLRARRHARIAENNPSQRGFLPGWILRVHRVRVASLAS